MKMLKYILSVFSIIISTQAFAEDIYRLDLNISNVTFTTIKKQFVIEPAFIQPVSGKLTSKGEFSVLLNPNNIHTGIPLRDARLKEIYFNVMKYPEIKVLGNFDTSLLSSNPQRHIISAKITMSGITKTIDLPIVIVPCGDKIMVNSSSPIIISGAEFGIPSENLINLAAKVGGIPISDKVPLNFNLLFVKELL